jgi:hypothetical protein
LGLNRFGLLGTGDLCKKEIIANSTRTGKDNCEKGVIRCVDKAKKKVVMVVIMRTPQVPALGRCMVYHQTTTYSPKEFLIQCCLTRPNHGIILIQL